MKKRATAIVTGLLGMGLAAMLWTGCTVTVVESSGPTTAPPAAPVVSVTCAPNQYLHGGKHVYRAGRWSWVAPRCVARTATWRAGCRWQRGHWVRSGRRYRFRAGRLVCPARVVGPTAMPPAPPVVRITCAPNQYLRGGKHVWRAGRWVWTAPRCVARTRTWRAGCRWTRGRWVRSGKRLAYRAGRLVCPKVVAAPPLRVVHPTWLPPRKPPVTYKRVRCARGTRYYPGRYKWNNYARRYTWRPGKCIAVRRGCKWVRGHWRYIKGRSYYVRPAWRCKGKVHYVGYGGSWKPPANYRTFIRTKRCRRGYFRNAANRCVRFKKRCATGFILRRGRCFKRYVPKRCGRNFVLRAGRCVRRAGAVVRPGRCRAGFRRVGNRCVRALKACRAGFRRVGKRCVRARVKACRVGFRRVGNKCVRALKACRPGFRRVGKRCKRIRKVVKCGRGTIRVGNKCVRKKRKVRCGRGTVRKGNKCVRIKRVKRVKRLKKCKRGFKRVGKRCKRIRRRR